MATPRQPSPATTISVFHPPEMPATFNAFGPATTIDPSGPASTSAHAHFLATDTTGAPIARCSVWCGDTPQLYDQPSGYLGHFAVAPLAQNADDNPHHPTDTHGDPYAQTVATLLTTACAYLKTHGCAWVIGPIDGSTFRRYRFVTQRTVDGRTHPPFFLEPDNPDSWPGYFLQAGFRPLAHYSSACGNLLPTDPSLDLFAGRARTGDARLRPADLRQFDSELEHVYTITRQSFARNYLYSPISRAEFIAQYAPVQKILRPELVWMAEKGERVVGFAFCLPDLAQAQRGEPIDTVIIKTIGILPDAGVLGLGHWLTAQCQVAAYELGYRRVIHALMHEDNISTKISRRYAQTMRRYTLFAKALA